jgi:hypothetical protein
MSTRNEPEDETMTTEIALAAGHQTNGAKAGLYYVLVGGCAVSEHTSRTVAEIEADRLDAGGTSAKIAARVEAGKRGFIGVGGHTVTRNV